MTADELDALLRQWGKLRGGREDDRDAPLGRTRHPLDVARDFAPGSRRGYVKGRMALDRAGQGRRALLAQGAGGREVIGYRILPAWAVDPVPCKETRAKAGQPYERMTPVPDRIVALERAVRELEDVSVRRATVLRVEYFTIAPQRVKAEEVSARLHTDVGLRLYRDELAHARTWVHGRMMGH